MPTPEYILELRRHIGHDLLYLPGVSAVVVRGREPAQELLLVRRSDNGRWSLPAGIVEPGEQPAGCMVREVLEETRVEVPRRSARAAAHRPAEDVPQRRCLPVHLDGLPLQLPRRRGRRRRRGVDRGRVVPPRGPTRSRRTGSRADRRRRCPNAARRSSRWLDRRSSSAARRPPPAARRPAEKWAQTTYLKRITVWFVTSFRGRRWSVGCARPDRRATPNAATRDRPPR